MNYENLQEKLDKLLEISDEKKQWAVDSRKAQMLAAQATAERAKARYEKTAKMVNDSKPIYKAEVIDDLYDVAWDVGYKTLHDVISPKIEEKDGKFMAILTVENMPESFEEELSKLLDEMSAKYGRKYSYKVENNKVIIICDVPNNLITATLEDILSGKKLPESAQNAEVANIVMDNIDGLNHQQLIKILENYPDSKLFPSRWDSENFGAYPVELAKAIADSDMLNESITDIYNVFYKDKELKDWKEAISVWKQDILNNFNKHYDAVLNAYDISDSEMYAEILNKISEEYPQFIKLLLNKYKKANGPMYNELVKHL